MFLDLFNKSNTNLLLIRLHYFLYVGGHAAVVNFAPIYAEQMGISASAVGIILAVTCCTTVISKTLIGFVTDHLQILKKMLMFLILVYMAAALGLNFMPTPYQKPVKIMQHKFLCYRNNSYIIEYNKLKSESYLEHFTNTSSMACSLCQFASPQCLPESSTNLSVQNFLHFFNEENTNTNETSYFIKRSLDLCLKNNESKCTESCFDGFELCTSVKGSNPLFQLALLCIFLTLVYVANGSVFSLSDAACYNTLGDRVGDYGKIRMWGTIGWGACVFGAGYLNQVFSKSLKVYSYSSSFYMLVVLFSIDLVVIKMIYLTNVTTSKNICKDIGKVFIKPRILLFVLGVYGIGIITGIFRAYFFWYMRSTLNASQFILGCTTAIQSFCSEVPFYYFSGFIIKKLGFINTFTMSYVAYGTKFLIHSFLTNPWWALLVELLQGPSFGSFYPAMTTYSKLISPEGTEAIVQGIVSGIFDGLGVATGSLLGGICMNNFGGRQTFYWTGVISLFAGIAHWLMYFIKDFKIGGSQQKNKKLDDAQEKEKENTKL